MGDANSIKTALSRVDGTRGTLILRGHPVADLAERASVESVMELFWGEGAHAQLTKARDEAFRSLRQEPLAMTDPMDALRASVALLPSNAPRERVAAEIAVVAAAWARRQRGEAPLAPSAASHAKDYLTMMHGSASEAQARALDMYFACIVDHGMNASTFAARVVASTQSDDVSATVAALGALKGRLHGGAPGPVLDMLDAIGSVDNARAWLESAIERRERIMGMGHRVYRVRDPRAQVLKSAFRIAGGDEQRLAFLETVEAEAEALLDVRYPGRQLRANVELYTAILLEALDIPRSLFTATFAAGRVIGWLAHTKEQRDSMQLIRPRSVYVGPIPEEEAG